MRGSLRRRGDAWELRIYAGRDPMTRKERVRTRTVRGSRREAERQLARWVADFTGRSADVTVGGVLERWLELRSPDWSPATTREHRRIVAGPLAPLGDTRVCRLTRPLVEEFYRALAERGGKDARPLSRGSVRRVHVVLRSALEEAVRWEWLDHNPAARARVPDGDRRRVRPPTAAEVGKLLLHAEETDPAFYAYLRLAVTTGARRGELCALRWSDLRDGVVLVHAGVVMGGDGLGRRGTKTGRDRHVTLDDATWKGLERLRRQAQGFRGRAWSAEDHVFSHEWDGRPWWPTSVSRKFRHLCEAVGVEGVRLHDLRHYVATQLIAAGEDIRTVAERLGHSQTSTTLNVYSAFLAEKDKKATGIMAATIPDPQV